MRLTIVPVDDLVMIDGFGLQGAVDLSILSPNIHAIQWDNDSGHIEYVDDTPNLAIVSITGFQPIIDSFTAKKHEIEHPIYTVEQSRQMVAIKIIAKDDFESEKPFPFKATFFKVSPSAIEGTLVRLKDIPVSSSLPINGGKWDDINGAGVLFTVQDLWDLRNGIYDRSAFNYGVRKGHINNINQLTTSEAVWSYDFSGDWQ